MSGEEKAERTPGEVFVRDGAVYYYRDGLRTPLASFSHVLDGDARANAVFVKTAWNSFDPLVRALEAVEWGGTDDAGSMCCPSCFAWPQEKEHEPDCQLAAALVKARA